MWHISTGTNNVQSGDLASAAKSIVTQGADDGAMSAADTSGIQHVRGIYQESVCVCQERNRHREEKKRENKRKENESDTRRKRHEDEKKDRSPYRFSTLSLSFSQQGTLMI